MLPILKPRAPCSCVPIPHHLRQRTRRTSATVAAAASAGPPHGAEFLESCLSIGEPSKQQFDSRAPPTLYPLGAGATYLQAREAASLHQAKAAAPEASSQLAQHAQQQLHAVLAHYRSQYPEAVWEEVASLAEAQAGSGPPVSVDIVGGTSEGSVAGVELALRGCRVLVLGSANACSLTQTLVEACSAGSVSLAPSGASPSIVAAGSADLVTCMHGWHLLDTQDTLLEAWRMLRPGGILLVAWQDRDPSSALSPGVERALQCHAPSLSRAAPLHFTVWRDRLQQRQLFRLEQFIELPNLVAISSPALLLGEAGGKLLTEGSALVLPLLAKLFVLRKVGPGDSGPRRGPGDPGERGHLLWAGNHPALD